MQTNHLKIYKTFIINALITEWYFLAELFFVGKKTQTFIIATKKPFYHWQMLDFFFVCF